MLSQAALVSGEMTDPCTALSTIDSVAQDFFHNGGYALVSLSGEQEEVIRKGFGCGRRALDTIQSKTAEEVQQILPSENSAHVTGYHSAGGMSKYNSHREGFVFSDGGMFSVAIEEDDDDFETKMMELQECLHTIANQALSQLEQHLELPQNWFQEHYKHNENHSQWHLKRYVCGVEDKEIQEEKVLLPSHTDPSLLSVVIVDQVGKARGAMGLQVYGKIPIQEKREWTELPFHGHAVATIFVGSVLSYITGGVCPSAKHRVIQKEVDRSTSSSNVREERMAATFFLRPKGTSILQVPPSPHLQGVSLKRKESTFSAWTDRVSRNYQQSKLPSSDKQGKKR